MRWGCRRASVRRLGFPGYWMYIGTTPVIHIAEWNTYTAHSQAKDIPVTAPAAEHRRV